MKLELRVNYSACLGSHTCGQCLLFVPELENGPVIIDSADEVADAATAAVNDCPTSALSLEVVE